MKSTTTSDDEHFENENFEELDLGRIRKRI
jgi:hypothetical protein